MGKIMIEMEKLKRVGLIRFLNNEKWDYDYTTINGIDYFQWEDEEPLNDISDLIYDLLPSQYDHINIESLYLSESFQDKTNINIDVIKEDTRDLLSSINTVNWLLSLPDKYEKV